MQILSKAQDGEADGDECSHLIFLEDGEHQDTQYDDP
jgi:hypothetical protein